MDIRYRELKERDDEDNIRMIWKTELLRSQTDPTSTGDYIKRRLETDMGDIYANYIKTDGTFFVAETSTVNTLNTLNTVNTMNTVNTVNTVNTMNTVNTVNTMDTTKIIGFIGVFYYKGEWTMVRLNVLDSYRRHKVGTTLCRIVIDWFKYNHPGKTLMGSTDITNKAAYDLLHKVGFKDKEMITNTITTMALDPKI
jgi:ribosomal protein S18 acetylase RimI-like enzyme